MNHICSIYVLCKDMNTISSRTVYRPLYYQRPVRWNIHDQHVIKMNYNTLKEYEQMVSNELWQYARHTDLICRYSHAYSKDYPDRISYEILSSVGIEHA